MTLADIMDIWVRKVMMMMICYAYVILGAASIGSANQSPRRFERRNQGEEELLSFLESAGSSPISPTPLAVMVPLTLIQGAAFKRAGIASFPFSLTLTFFVNYSIVG